MRMEGGREGEEGEEGGREGGEEGRAREREPGMRKERNMIVTDSCTV